MARLGIIELSQLPPFLVLESINTEAIMLARMQRFALIWAQRDPPNAAQYDVGGLEFDPIRINQECSTYFELMLRDRVNQAARAVTGAFAVGGDLDAIASRYPGGVPRLPSESDLAYRTRIWLSPNTLSPNGVYESYIFYAFNAVPADTLRDCQALATPGKANVYITILADGAPITALQKGGLYNGTFSPYPNPTPSNDIITQVYQYIRAPGLGRKGMTDVISVSGPKIKPVDYKIRILLYPGWDETSTMQALYPALANLLENQRYLGFSHTLAAIDAALKVSGVFNVLVDSPTADVIIPTDSVIFVNSISLTYGGRAGFGPLPPSS